VIDDHWCLSEADIFRDLAEREVAAIGARVSLHTVGVGQVVYAPLQRTDMCFIVKRGRVRLYRATRDGGAVTVAVAEEGTIFGEMDLLGLRMPAMWAEVIESGLLCVMGRQDVRDLLLSDPRIATRVTEQMGARLAQLERRFTDDGATKTVAECVAGALVALSRSRVDSGHRTVRVWMTTEQLAGLVHATTEETREALGTLVEHGFVKPRTVWLLVRDLAGLASYADGAYRAPNAGTTRDRPGAAPDRSGVHRRG
jgi:CRP-like cAMP-binding protein